MIKKYERETSFFVVYIYVKDVIELLKAEGKVEFLGKVKTKRGPTNRKNLFKTISPIQEKCPICGEI